jgi:biotin transport system substrate-specific component
MFLLGPTGGYIFGFILAALFIGYFADKYIRTRKFIPMLAIMLFANFVLIYIPGMIQLGLWSNMIAGVTPTLWQLLLMGMIPFVIGDVTKIVIAATIATSITPKENFS